MKETPVTDERALNSAFLCLWYLQTCSIHQNLNTGYLRDSERTQDTTFIMIYRGSRNKLHTSRTLSVLKGHDSTLPSLESLTPTSARGRSWLCLYISRITNILSLSLSYALSACALPIYVFLLVLTYRWCRYSMIRRSQSHRRQKVSKPRRPQPRNLKII